MTDPEQDDVFEAYLKRRSVLPAVDDELEPPAALDQKVLNQAREAIQPQAGKSAPQRPPRWAVPVALAATIMLCLSVVMNISLNTNRPSPNIERMAKARADVKTSALSNATAESDAAAGVSAPSIARDAVAANNGERRESVSGDISSGEVVLPRAKVAGAPAPHAPVVAEASGPAGSAGTSGALTPAAPPAASGALTTAAAPAASGARTPAAPPAASGARTPAAPSAASDALTAAAPPAASDARTAAAPPAASDARTAAAPSAANAPPVLADAPARQLERKSERSLADKADRGSGAMASANSVAPSAPPGGSNALGGIEARNAPSAADKAVRMAKEAGVAAPQYTPAPEQERAAIAARKAAKAAAVEPHPADPKVWLQQIDALRAAGKNDQADAEMRRFKAAFPHYGAPSAPADLPK